MIMTVGRVHSKSRQAVSLHQSNAAEGETGMCMMSSTTEMHVAGSKISIRSMSVFNRSSAKKGTMTTMVPIATNLTDSILPKEGVMQDESRRSPKT
jgi:hypothetical protein